MYFSRVRRFIKNHKKDFRKESKIELKTELNRIFIYPVARNKTHVAPYLLDV